MFNIDQITTLDIETINNCNALCPLCLRGEGMTTNDRLDWPQVVKQIPDAVWKQVKKINFNGTTGDNVMHPKIADILEWTINNTNAQVSLHTNGSLRSTTWWSELGKVFGTDHRVVFGIDGMQDTHGVYRVNTDWQKIIDNAQAFINGGGRAIWQFIVFKHNQHQLNDCRLLSKKLGFSKFLPIYQDRFDNSNSKGQLHRADIAVIPVDTIVKTTSNSFDKKNFAQAKVKCLSQEIGWIGIYADGTIWPCCWLMGWHLAKHQKMQYAIINYHFKKILNIDFTQISLYNKTLEEIIGSDLWQKRFPDSFNNNPNPVCVQQCSK